MADSYIEEKVVGKTSIEDLDMILSVARQMGGSCDVDYYRFSFGLKDVHEREVFLAEIRGEATGFVMLNHAPKYRFFQLEGLPEIQDLNVLPEYRRRGIGAALITYCENIVRSKGGDHIGIGVGLTALYGAAQRLYVRMGYVPDGFGMTYDRRIVRHGELCTADDDLSLMMVKNLHN